MKLYHLKCIELIKSKNKKNACIKFFSEQGRSNFFCVHFFVQG
jgi:hypothetical protein